MSTPTSILTEEMRQQAIGVETAPITMEVEKGAILRFAEAIGDSNPQWNDESAARKSRYGGLIAPPTFLRSMRSVRAEPPFDLSLTRLLDGGSDWEYFEPVRAGDRITAVARIADLAERQGRLGPMVLLTAVITYRNQFDEVVATQTNTSIRY
ncbi:MAG: MaoC family dehydratase N-terminal domain-containing protein [Dehalococcoidia bacterium]